MYTSQVSEFFMLKPVQPASRAHLSEQLCSEDDDIVSIAVVTAFVFEHRKKMTEK